MANDLNVWSGVGRLGRDPESRHVGDTVKATLRIAVGRSFKKRNGEKHEETVWLDVEVWGPQAEACMRYLTKGRQVAVTGQLQMDEWESDGQKRSKLYVRAQSVQFLGGDREGGQQGGGGGYGGSSRGGGGGGGGGGKQYGGNAYDSPDMQAAMGVPDDEVPF